MIVHKPSKSLVLKVRPKTLAQLMGIFPSHHKLLDYDGHNIAVPHNLAVVKVLRNMGIKAPSPIRYYYDWPRPARFESVFDHQYATADFLTLHSRCFVLNEMGTSKTACVLWAADYLMRLGKIKRALIVAPLSTLKDTWLQEIFSVCMHRTGMILHADAERRRDRLSKPADFYIINPAGLKVLKKDLLARKDIDVVIVDECSDYRNGQTEQYEILEQITQGRKLWMLSGAPCPTAPTDAWALARLVDKSRVPKFFSQWRRETMYQVSQHKWVPRPGSNELAYNALQPAIRFKKADCLQLPPVTFLNRSAELSVEQGRTYLAMKNHLVAEAQGEKITAANAAIKIIKLRQILCGAVKREDGTYITIDHKPRLRVLQELIEQSSSKVLIIVPFKGIARALAEELRIWHNLRGDGRRVEVVNGDVSQTKRDKIWHDFRNDASLTEAVCHPKVMAHGLTLTDADMVVFYAPIYSNDQSMQVMDRINRPGQKRKMTIARIAANRFEQEIYAMVEGRRITQESMLDLYKRELGLDLAQVRIAA